MNSNKPSTSCDGCIMRKSRWAIIPKKIISQASAVLDLIHSDFVGPLEVQYIGVYQYLNAFIDDHSIRTVKNTMQKIRKPWNNSKYFTNTLRQTLALSSIYFELTMAANICPKNPEPIYKTTVSSISWQSTTHLRKLGFPNGWTAPSWDLYDKLCIIVGSKRCSGPNRCSLLCTCITKSPLDLSRPTPRLSYMERHTYKLFAHACIWIEILVWYSVVKSEKARCSLQGGNGG